MSERPLIEPSSGDGLVRKVLMLVGLLAFIPIVMFAPRGGDADSDGVRRAASGADAAEAGVEEMGTFPLREEPAREDDGPGAESTLLPELRAERTPGSPPPGL